MGRTVSTCVDPKLDKIVIHPDPILPFVSLQVPSLDLFT